MGKSISIKPITRIEGHASINIQLDDAGDVSQTTVAFTSLRGFEKFVQGKPAEELPRIVSRICGICPWMHHIASVKAVESCFNVNPAPAGDLLRELMLTIAHVEDKLLHFFFLAGADFFISKESDYSVRNIMGLVKANPKLAQKVVKMRSMAKMILERFSKKAIHPIAAVPGGFSKPLENKEREEFKKMVAQLLDFAVHSLEYAKRDVFPRFQESMQYLGDITTGFMGMVDEAGGMNFYNGKIRLMKPDTSYVDFHPDLYKDHICEKVLPFSYGKFPYAKSWGEGFSIDISDPKGIYRSNTLARLNTADHIPTPKAQEELEEFRRLFGRPVQTTLLYHYARLIEEVYACERAMEILDDPRITDREVKNEVAPAAGRGVGCVEAPRGTLIHDYTTDENGLIESANLIVGTTHNLAPINMSVDRAARDLIKKGRYDEEILNKIEMAVRAYDP